MSTSTSNKFLTGGSGSEVDITALQNGSLDIDVASLRVASLIPGADVNANSQRKISSFNDVNRSELNFSHNNSPSNPSTGNVKLISKSDGFLHSIDEFGVETRLGSSSAVGSSWTFRSYTDFTSPSVSNGDVAFNNTVTASVTQILLSVYSNEGNSVLPILELINAGDTILIKNEAESNVKLFHITGKTEDPNYFILDIDNLQTSETNTANYSAGDVLGGTLHVSGNPFNQVLNTGSDVQFNSLSTVNMTESTLNRTTFNGEVFFDNDIYLENNNIRRVGVINTTNISVDKIVPAIGHINTGILEWSDATNKLSLTGADFDAVNASFSGVLSTANYPDVDFKLFELEQTDGKLNTEINNVNGDVTIVSDKLRNVENSTIGIGNTGLGHLNLENMGANGNLNTAIGMSSLSDLLPDSFYNTAIGVGSGQADINSTQTFQPRYNTFLGASTKYSKDGPQNSIAIGYGAEIKNNAECVIGGIQSSKIETIRGGAYGLTNLGSAAIPFGQGYFSGNVSSPNIITLETDNVILLDKTQNLDNNGQFLSDVIPFYDELEGKQGLTSYPITGPRLRKNFKVGAAGSYQTLFIDDFIEIIWVRNNKQPMIRNRTPNYRWYHINFKKTGINTDANGNNLGTFGITNSNSDLYLPQFNSSNFYYFYWNGSTTPINIDQRFNAEDYGTRYDIIITPERAGADSYKVSITAPAGTSFELADFMGFFHIDIIKNTYATFSLEKPIPTDPIDGITSEQDEINALKQRVADLEDLIRRGAGGEVEINGPVKVLGGF